MTDIITLGETMAVFSPKTTGPLRYVNDYTTLFAGAESNTAIGVQKLGRSAEWFSRIGDDELGQYILNKIRAEGVDTSHVIIDPEHRTGLMLKEFSLANETKVFYYRENSAASHMNADDISDDLIKHTKILHFTGITPILSEDCHNMTLNAMKIAKEHNVLISFDPNIRLKLWGTKDYTHMIIDILKNVNIAMLGLDEANYLFQTRQVEDVLNILFQSEHVKYVALKDGANGAYVANRLETHFIAPYPCNCVDPIGAGDAFNAGFLVGILDNEPLKTCGEIAGIVGALCTQTPGDIEGIPSKQDVLNILHEKKVIYR